MVFLIKEYEIPFLGKLQLMDSNGGYVEYFNGKYYAKNKILGEFCKNCNSMGELMKKISKEVGDYFRIEADKFGRQIEKEKEDKKNLEFALEEMTLLENAENFENWLKKYQTGNPLQLEYQEAEKQKNKIGKNN
jgi:hypothetical protein